jgi:hypothetical protein
MPNSETDKRTDRRGDGMRREYDFSKGVRGATAKRFASGSNIVVLDPDVAVHFPDSASVNRALRTLTADATKSTAARRTKRSAKAPQVKRAAGKKKPRRRSA